MEQRLMNRPRHIFSPVASGSYEKDDQAVTPMQKAGYFLKELRRAKKLTQSKLAEAVDVGRGTIERLESGDVHVGVGTVLHVLTILGVSPWHYYELATQARRTAGEIHQQ